MSFWTLDRNRTNPQYSERTAALIHNVAPMRKALVTHPVYTNIGSLKDLHVFMKYHVFAVWDFMSLLKSLQQQLSCVKVPWVPIGDPNTRRLVNDIVMSEETDEDGEGGYCSHFELYLRSMRQIGVDTSVIDSFIERMRKRDNVASALIISGAPRGAVIFVNRTFEILDSRALHRIAACFTFSREDVVPEMFLRIVEDLRNEYAVGFDRFIYYLDRHIAVDSEVHGPMAFDMIASICGDDERKWKEAEQAAVFGIRARIHLWDAVMEELKPHGMVA